VNNATTNQMLFAGNGHLKIVKINYISKNFMNDETR